MIALLAAVALASPHRFTITHSHGQSWFVDPSGHRFLSLGVCVVDQGTQKKEYTEKNPSYASYLYYPDTHTWATDVIGRLQRWGFNTIGAWSDLKDLKTVATKGLYYMPVLHMGSGAGAPWVDMWDPKVIDLMDKIARDQILALKGDQRVVGYFSDNEMGWWEGALFDWGWKAKPGSGTRTRLVDTLRSSYHGSWRAFRKDFVAPGSTSFHDLAVKNRAWLRPGGHGMAAVQRYIAVLADRYYSLCKASIRRYDPQALYLGDRYISNFYPEVAKQAGKYVDVLSTNLNADWFDGTFAHFYLPELERLTHKPILISEYYVAAKENRTGNKNDSSGFPVVQTQAQRAAVFAIQTRFFLEHSYVVGAHWFQYYDEPKNGRGDGENYDMGLVDVKNQPYSELTSVSAALPITAVHRNGPLPMPLPGDIPPAPSDPSKLVTWNRILGYLPPMQQATRGDLYLSWASDALYGAIYWNEDRFAEAFYRGGSVAAQDRPRFAFRVNGHRYEAVGGEGFAPIVRGCSLVSSRSGVRNELIFRIPMKLHGGQKLRFSGVLDTRGRAYTQRWSHIIQLAGRG